MWSYFNTPFTKGYKVNKTSYCYNFVTFKLSQSDHIMRFLHCLGFCKRVSLPPQNYLLTQDDSQKTSYFSEIYFGDFLTESSGITCKKCFIWLGTQEGSPRQG